jgi:YggT family protein
LPAPICFVLNLYILVIIARMIFSWVRVEPDSPWARVDHALLRITEPVLGPIRRTIPPLPMGAMYLDLSPIIVFVVIRLLCH